MVFGLVLRLHEEQKKYYETYLTQDCREVGFPVPRTFCEKVAEYFNLFEKLVGCNDTHDTNNDLSEALAQLGYYKCEKYPYCQTFKLKGKCPAC